MARSAYIYLVYGYCKLVKREILVGCYTVKYQSETCSKRTYDLGCYEGFAYLTRYRTSDGYYHMGEPMAKKPCPWETHSDHDFFGEPDA